MRFVSYLTTSSGKIVFIPKPILDIMGEVSNAIKADMFKPVLEKIGYSWKGEYGILENLNSFKKFYLI